MSGATKSCREPNQAAASGPGELRSPVRLTLVAKACELVTLVALVTLVPRLLGPEAFGVFALATAVVAIGSLSMSLGGPTLLARFVPAASAERQAVARALGTRLLLWRLVGVAGFVAVGGAASLVAPADVRPTLAALVVAAAALDVLATLAFQLALGMGHVGAWSFRYPLQNVLLIGAALLGWVVFGTSGAVAGVAVSSGLTLAVGAALVVPSLLSAPAGAPIPPGALRFGTYGVLTGVFLILLQRGGIPTVAVLDGSSAEIGFAAIAIGTSLAASFALTQALLVQLPSLAARTGGDPLGSEAAARTLAQRLVLTGAVSGCVAVLVVEPVLPRALGAGFEGAVDAFVPALAVLPLAPLASLGSQIATLRLEPARRLVPAIVGAIVFALVAVPATAAAGAVGATASLLAGTVALVLAFALVLSGAFERRQLLLAVGGAAAVLLLGALALNA